jgi:AhpD family alkylhydroperoxidase
MKGKKMFDDKMTELVAIGASVAANCHPCVKYHVNKAREVGVDKADIAEAISVGKMVRKGAAGKMDELTSEIL